MFFRYFGLFLVFSLFFGSIWGLQTTEIHLDVLDSTPYFDYLVQFDKGFTLSLPDFESPIYVKIIPTDINFLLSKGKIEVLEDLPGTLILKYKGQDFLEGKTSFEKTLDFGFLGTSKITLTSDTNILKTNPEPDSTNGAYYWKTDKDKFLLYIVLEKKQSLVMAVVIIVLSLAIISFLAYVLYKKKWSTPSKQNLLLDETQNKVLDIVKKKQIVNQQDLGKELGLQKSHLTKVLHKMERNNLIERKKVGKINKIVLAEEKTVQK